MSFGFTLISGLVIAGLLALIVALVFSSILEDDEK